ncbi:MAG: hypothetical protein Q9203_000071 [Teloschistes exilis]
MKYDAIVEQGIPIHERVPIPDELVPEDSRVEIDATSIGGVTYHSCYRTPRSEALYPRNKLKQTKVQIRKKD